MTIAEIVSSILTRYVTIAYFSALVGAADLDYGFLIGSCKVPCELCQDI